MSSAPRNVVTPPGKTYPWIIRSTAMVNHYYVYILDRDFGPLFIKFCSYFPYPAKLCLNGHEWLKRQLTQRDIPFEPLDNGIRSSDAPARVQRIADTLDAPRSMRSFANGSGNCPIPLRLHTARPGIAISLSILQSEFALDPSARSSVTGAVSSKRSSVRISTWASPRRCNSFSIAASRVVPRGASARACSLRGSSRHSTSQYKKSKVKQYHKEGQALRTETTINDTYDFEIGRALRNLPALREIGFAANRRLLRVEYLSHDCLIGDDHLDTVTQPIVVDTQRAAGLRFGDRRVLALMQSLCLFALSPAGFRHRDVRTHLAQLRGCDLATYQALDRPRTTCADCDSTD